MSRRIALSAPEISAPSERKVGGPRNRAPLRHRAVIRAMVLGWARLVVNGSPRYLAARRAVVVAVNPGIVEQAVKRGAVSRCVGPRASTNVVELHEIPGQLSLAP